MRLIAITQGQHAIVDDEDYDFLSMFKWWAQKHPGGWYAARRSFFGPRRVTLGMHQLLLFGGAYVDHENGNGLDNRRCNIRFATSSQNCYNKSMKSPLKTSRFKGVYWDKRDKKWDVRIRHIPGERLFLGRFDCELTAGHVYDEAAKKYFGDFARLNFPNDAPNIQIRNQEDRLSFHPQAPAGSQDER